MHNLDKIISRLLKARVGYERLGSLPGSTATVIVGAPTSGGLRSFTITTSLSAVMAHPELIL